jgi:hypothetical protein
LVSKAHLPEEGQGAELARAHPATRRYKRGDISGAACPERGMVAGLVLTDVYTEAMILHPEEIARAAVSGI